MSTEELKRELDQMTDEFCQEGHVCRAEESAVYKECASTSNRMMREMEERKARDQPRQMMDAQDVSEALGVSKSSAYKIIKKLNNELEAANYITVRGKISRLYFEKRTYGVSVDAG